MRKLSLVVLGLALLGFVGVPLLGSAQAQQSVGGEQPLGQVVITDAGSVNNRNTAVPFTLGKNLDVTIQCPDGGAWVAVDGRTTCEAGFPCFSLPAGAMIDTTIIAPADGGTQGLFAVACPSGTAACSCSVFKRTFP